MSLYGAFDYLDILSRGSRPSEGNEEANEASSEEEDYLVLDEAVDTTVAESDATTLPSEIHFSSDDGHSGEGLTILPSVPSEEAAAAQELQERQLQALSMQVQGAPRNTRNALSLISLSTTESHFTNVVHEEDSHSSVSSLSLSVSTLPSSGFTEEIIFEEHSNASLSSASSSSSSSSSSDQSTLVKDVPKMSPRPSLFSKPKGPWYSHLETDEDWEAFRSECLAVMEAMGDEAPNNPEELLSQLIAQEEQMLYCEQKVKGTLFGLSYETVAMIAGATLVPLVGFALASRGRRPKAE